MVRRTLSRSAVQRYANDLDASSSLRKKYQLRGDEFKFIRKSTFFINLKTLIIFCCVFLGEVSGGSWVIFLKEIREHPDKIKDKVSKPTLNFMIYFFFIKTFKLLKI